MSEPRLYYRNWVDSQSIFSLSHGGNSSYLYDRGETLLYTTSGANSDATTSSIYVYFYEGVIQKNRIIDAIFLKNYNWKNWSASWWNGSSWPTITSDSNDTNTSRYIGVSPVTTNAVRFDITSTKTANQEKSIGEIVVCQLLSVAGNNDFSSYDPKWRERTKEIVLGDGAIHRVNVKDSAGRLCKYEAATKFTYLSKSTRDELKAIKDAGQPFLLQPESVTVPEDVYYVHWANAWDEKYMSSYKGSGYEVIMNVKEV